MADAPCLQPGWVIVCNVVHFFLQGTRGRVMHPGWTLALELIAWQLNAINFSLLSQNVHFFGGTVDLGNMHPVVACEETGGILLCFIS